MSPLVLSAFSRFAPPMVVEGGTTEWVLLSLPSSETSRRIGLDREFDSSSGRLARCACVDGSARSMDDRCQNPHKVAAGIER